MKIAPLLLLSAALLSGCATTAPRPDARQWKFEPTRTKEGETRTKITWLGGKKPVVVLPEAWYDHYRAVPKEKYREHHLPAEAQHPIVGQQSVDRSVLFVIESDKSSKVYSFSYGLYDIDWPPRLLHTEKKE